MIACDALEHTLHARIELRQQRTGRRRFHHEIRMILHALAYGAELVHGPVAQHAYVFNDRIEVEEFDGLERSPDFLPASGKVGTIENVY